MKPEIKFFDYPMQFKIHEKEYLRVIQNVLSRGAYILCSEVEEFEANLAKFVGTKYAVGVGNCTEALYLSLRAAGIGPEDEVITVSHTFVATVEVIKSAGAIPVLIDIAEDHNMNVELVEAAITPKTKAVMPVQLNGRICTRMDRLVEICQKHNLFLIEDSAQALGATYQGRGAGSFGLTGNFSFYPAKLLGAFGDAGAVVTDNAQIAEKIKALRNHGRTNETAPTLWGFNCRIDNLHAAILDYKLKMLPEWLVRRREIARIYDDGLAGISEIILPVPPQDKASHYDVFQNYEIEVERKAELVTYLKQNGISVMLPWGGRGVHQFKALGLNNFSLPRTEKLLAGAVMLPLYPELSNAQIECVIFTIKKFYDGRRP